MFRKLTLLIMLCTLTSGIAKAVDWTPSGSTSATYTLTTSGTGFKVNSSSDVYDGIGNIVVSNGAVVNIVFNTTKPVICNGHLRVTKGELNLSLGSGYGSSHTIERGSALTDDWLLDLCAATSVSVSDCKMTVTGNSSKKFHIHGGANYTVSGSNALGWTATAGTGCVKSERALVLLRGGTATFDYVIFSNNWNNAQDLNKIGAGAIHVTKLNTNCDITMNNCLIKDCYTETCGSAIFISATRLSSDVYSSIKLNSCVIDDCFCNAYDNTTTKSTGGTLRTSGLSTCNVTLDNCTFNDNKSLNNGGAIYWNSIMSELEVTNCSFKSNYAKGAGGAMVTCSYVNLAHSTFDGNYATESGGAIYFATYTNGSNALTPAQVTPKDASLTLDATTSFTNNTTETYGGAICINVRPMNMTYTGGGSTPWTVFKNNEGKRFSMSVFFNGSTMTNNHAAYGGGIAVIRSTDIYSSDLHFNYGILNSNDATQRGGCVYVTSYETAIYYGLCPFGSASISVNFGDNIADHQMTVQGNSSVSDGGGIYIKHTGTSVPTISCSSCQIGGASLTDGNKTTNGNGGAICVEGGNVEITGGNILYNSAKKNGGGGYVSGGMLTINGGNIDANNASINGGGFYVDGGDLYLYGGIIGQTYGNHADGNGGGVYANGGEINISNGYIQYNTATMGGGFYVQGGESTIEGGTVQYNTATNGGGGLYMKGTDDTHKAIANFSNGSFSGNSATTAGGGIYLADYSELYMSGTSAITGNSAGVKGGGVFKTAGNGHSKLQVSGTSLQVVNNTAGGQRNNVYLDGYSDYITVDPVAGISDQVKVGISVNVNSAADLPTPVIHCDDDNKLNDIFNMLKTSTGTSGVFDDASKYLAVYQSHPLPFNDKEIFFIATWIAEVTQPEHFDNTKISTPDELAWFMVLVNGLNGQEARPGLNGTVINDIDMSAYFWTPIGEWNHGDQQAPQSIYGGTFDGQGHVISGISTCGVINYYNYGLFGHTGSTANIKNVVLADCDFTSGETKRMGNLIAEMDGGTVSNCIVSGKLNSSGSETQGHDEHYCVVGGLIGETKNSATIRNCIATEQIQAEPIDDTFYPKMQAFTVGGLVGMASAGTVIENCFANPEIHHGGKQGNETTLTDPNRYVGGLIGENHGTVRNCYVRLQRDNQLTATVSKFGMFAGENSGTIEHCFYPESSLRNIMVGSTSTPDQFLIKVGNNPANYGEYNTTVTPYYYKHNDNLVTMDDESAPSGSLLAKLNEWVEEANTANGDSDYSYWMRTSASPINGDYPVLEYDNLAGTMGYTTIASRDGINMEYNKSLNTMIGKYNTNGSALFVYNTPAEEINKSTAIPLYVGEDAALQLKPGTAITNAYVGITLDNSKSKTVGNETGNQFNWHMFSTPLAAAPLGVNYQDNHTSYNYWNSQDIPDFGFYPEGNALHGYFPSKTFGTDGTDGVPYYAEWDYYTYLEPHYHWINFKRNSESHYHQDTDNPQYPNHSQIVYANETELVKGKGYLLATKEETYLQCNGTLNSGEVSIALDYTEDNHPVYRGCNLLGNPYQSYLNFDETGLGSYAILDEDLGGYVAYTKGASRNAYPTLSKEGGEITAPGKYIHMHQGFFVVASASGQGVTFTPSMCTNLADGSFRGEEQPAYPLVNLAVTEADGSREFVTIELDRPDNGGAVKMKGLRNGSSLIYTHVDGEDYSIAFMPVGTTTAAVRFETLDEGTFTMNWNTQNGAFSYLHLIDNKTGMDIDCLASGEYRFKASPEDYASRFKLVFSYTGVEEAEAEAEDFAFLMNGILVINGEGTADIFDLTGRLVSSTRLTGSQNTLSLPALTQGLYMIRLSNGNGSKVQKIVIK